MPSLLPTTAKATDFKVGWEDRTIYLYFHSETHRMLTLEYLAAVKADRWRRFVVAQGNLQLELRADKAVLAETKHYIPQKEHGWAYNMTFKRQRREGGESVRVRRVRSR